MAAMSDGMAAVSDRVVCGAVSVVRGRVMHVGMIAAVAHAAVVSSGVTMAAMSRRLVRVRRVSQRVVRAMVHATMPSVVCSRVVTVRRRMMRVVIHTPVSVVLLGTVSCRMMTD